MAKEKYTSLTTPIGSAYFAHLFETEKFDEKTQVNILSW